MNDELIDTGTDNFDNGQQITRQKLSRYLGITLSNRNVFVDLLLIFFGIGSWIGIQSVFLQVPLLVDTAPEGWRLPSFITITIQIGNIGPIIYTILQTFPQTRISDANFIYGVKLIAAISSLLMAFFYESVVTIGHTQYSLALLILVFFFALVACTSSVLFMPYMGRFKEIYLVTYLIGEGVSGLVPSIVALIQGIGGSTECVLINNATIPPKYEPLKPSPNFSTLDFFLFVFSVMLCSLVAFILLENLSVCKREYDKNVKISFGNTYEYTREINDGNMTTNKILFRVYRFKKIFALLILISFIGNGVLPSIQSFSCMPFGNNVYHLTVSLTLIANPVSCVLAIFLPHSSIRLILTLIGCFILTSTYIIVTALMSPEPFLINSNFGGILIIIIWTVHTGIFSYIKLCITTFMRPQGGNSLVWIGGIAQIGTVLGTIFIFVIVNYSDLFKEIDPC